MNEQTDRVLLELLRSGLWGYRPEVHPETLEISEWKLILERARQQTVLGLVFDGLQNGHLQVPDKKDMFKLTMYVARIEQLNRILNRLAADLSEKFRKQNVPVILLKGQGVAVWYPNPLRRQCGDIDLYVGKSNLRKVKDLFLEWGYDVDFEQISDKHLKVRTDQGIHIDVHWVTTMTLSAKYDRPFRLWEQQMLEGGEVFVNLEAGKIQVPPPLFNAVFLFMHLFNHFMSEGISFRQICDWGLCLRQEDVRKQRKELELCIRKYGLVKPWQVFSSVAVNYLGFDPVDFPLYKSGIEKKAAAVYKRIMDGGNFGKFRERKDFSNRPWILWKMSSFWYHHRHGWNMIRLFPQQYVRYYSRLWWLACENLKYKIRSDRNRMILN